MESPKVNGPLIAGVLAAVAASVCCVGPLVLLALGITGAWIANLTALEPLRPVFAIAAIAFFALGFRRLYLGAPACVTGTRCSHGSGPIRQRFLFWFVTVSVFALLASPWIAPLLY